MKMNCPKCRGLLTERTVGDIVVDQCETCHGVWLDMGELPALIAFHKKHDDSPIAGNGETITVYDALQAPCPRCGGVGNMTRITNLHNSALVMDSCSVCYGIWLDGGELQKLMDRGVGFTIKSFFRNLFG